MEIISPSTQICGIFGQNISYTLSPLMHNQAFRQNGQNAVYLCFQFCPDFLPTAIESIRGFNWLGVNVTIPYKNQVFPFLDNFSQEAAEIGAINTIVNRSGKLWGYNTDLDGIVDPIAGCGVEIQGAVANILGAGGAARAAAYALAKEKAMAVRIFNRTLARAEKIAADFAPLFSNTDFSARKIGKINEQIELLPGAIFLVNCLPGQVAQKLFGRIKFNSGSHKIVAFDLNYNPIPRAFINWAKEEKFQNIISGEKMLVSQGGKSFKLWTGKDAPLEVMAEAVDRALRGKKNQ